MSEESKVQRRTFLAQCTAAGACGVAGSSRGKSAAANEIGALTSGPTIDDFKPLIGTRFQVERESGGCLVVELSEVTPANHDTPAQFRRPFSLIFRVPGDQRLSQDVYTVKHPHLKPFRPLLVPVDLPAKHNNLQAVFC